MLGLFILQDSDREILYSPGIILLFKQSLMLIVTIDQRGIYSSNSGLRLDSKAIGFFAFNNINR